MSTYLDISYSNENHSRNYIYCGELTPEDDLKHFVGASEDKDSENFIVTYTYSVVIYKVTDSEKVPSVAKHCEWRTKCRLTSPVVYDANEDCYVGAFNGDIIRVWSSPDDIIDDVEKYKFRQPILKLLPRENKSSLIIFTNGDSVSLAYGLENCKTHKSKALVRETSSIVDTVCFTRNQSDHLCHIARNLDNSYKIVIGPLKDDSCECDQDKVKSIKVTRENAKESVSVTGKIILKTESPIVYFQWNDLYVTRYDVNKNSWRHTKLRYSGTSYVHEIVTASIGKKLLFSYGKCTYRENGAIVTIDRLEERDCGGGYSPISLDWYSKKTKIYSCGHFIILMDLKRIYLWKNVIYT